MKRRGLALRIGTIASSLTMIVVGAVAVSGGTVRYSVANAAAGPLLEIAPGSTDSFGRSADVAWHLDNAAAGDTATGTVRIRAITDGLLGASLRVGVTFPGGDGGLLARHVLVSAATYNGEDVLDAWPSSCRDQGSVTLASFSRCGGPLLAAPPPGDGWPFSMTLEIEPAAGAELSGLTTGPFTVVFTLQGDTSAGAVPSASPAGQSQPPPPDGVIDVVAGARSEGPAAHIGGNESLLGLTAGAGAGAIAIGVAGVLILFALRRRRRRRDEPT